jgi:hypothetical protein
MTIARLDYNYLKRREAETGFSLSQWVRERHRSDPRIVGASYAHRERGGEWTGEAVIAVFVQSKPTVDITPALADWSLPRELGFAAVDVRVTGPLTAIGCLETKMRPAPGGASIGDGAESLATPYSRPKRRGTPVRQGLRLSVRVRHRERARRPGHRGRTR